MDKILEKLGIYDLIVLLLTGMIILLFSINIMAIYIFGIKIEINNYLEFLIISYFVGMVFQEFGSKLNSKKLLKSVFETSNDLRTSLSQVESEFKKIYSKSENKVR